MESIRPGQGDIWERMFERETRKGREKNMVMVIYP